MTDQEKINSYVDLTKKINKAKYLLGKYENLLEDLQMQRERLSETMPTSVFLEAWVILEKAREKKEEEKNG